MLSAGNAGDVGLIPGKVPWRRNRLPTLVFLGFPGGSAGKGSACNVIDLGSIPRVVKIPWRRERLHTPVFWPGEFHGVTKSQTRLSDFHFTCLTMLCQFLPYRKMNQLYVYIIPLPFEFLSKNLQTRNAGDGVEKREHFYTVGGSIN